MRRKFYLALMAGSAAAVAVGGINSQIFASTAAKPAVITVWLPAPNPGTPVVESPLEFAAALWNKQHPTQPVKLNINQAIPFSAFHLLNSYQGVILVYAAGGIPLSIWILKGTFDTVPHEVIEAARIDGAGEMTIAWRIMMPMSIPGVVASGILTFIGSWLDFVVALTLLSNASLFPFTVGLFSAYEGQTGVPDVGALFAGALVGSLPATLLFLLFQHRIGGGLGSAAGAIKG